MRSEFVFKLLDGIGPVDRFGRLVVVGDKLADRLLQVLRTDKVIGLQQFALQKTKPDFDLIEPRGIGRQPEHLEVQSPFTGLFLLPQPAFELLRRMRGSIVHNQDHRVDFPPQRFGNDLLEKKGLEIGEVLARATGTVDTSISHGKPGKQMPCPAPMVARLPQLWMPPDGRTWWLFAFTCLDRGFLVQTHRPGSLSQQA